LEGKIMSVPVLVSVLGVVSVVGVYFWWARFRSPEQK
jgi:hypothetical protein